MRFIEYETIMEQMTLVLEDQILPALEDVEARQQSWAAIGLLDNIASRMRSQDGRLELEIEALEGLLESAPAEVPVKAGSIPEPSLPPRQRRMALADCLASALTELAGSDGVGNVGEWLDRCGRTLLEIEVREMEVMRPTRYFQSMNG